MKTRHNKIEIIIYSIIWVLVFLVPYLMNEGGQIEQEQLYRRWFHLSAFLLIFIVNIAVLIPKFLEKKRYKLYGFSVVALVFITIFVYMYFRHIEVFPQIHIPPIKNFARFSKDFFDNFLIGILVVGLGTAAKLIKSWINEQAIRSELEKEQLKTNLNLLKNQVSPHFFMNTLNNIHALIDIDSDKAKESIILLSTMMRYLLYDSTHDRIILRKEIEFIESYIALMRLRHSEKVIVKLNFPNNTGEVKIPPMLFASFIENAFKYGVNYRKDSIFSFEIIIVDNYLKFIAINDVNKTNRISDYGGLGISNSRQTLDLLYGKDYELNITENDAFKVELTIPL